MSFSTIATAFVVLAASSVTLAGGPPFTDPLFVQGSGNFNLVNGGFEGFDDPFMPPVAYYSSGGTSGGIVGINSFEIARAGFGVGAQYSPSYAPGGGAPAIYVDGLGSTSFDPEFDTQSTDGSTLADVGFFGFISWSIYFEITAPTNFGIVSTPVQTAGGGLTAANLSFLPSLASVDDLQNFPDPFDDIVTPIPGPAGVLQPGLYRLAGTLSFSAPQGSIDPSILNAPFNANGRFAVVLPSPGGVVLSVIAGLVAAARRR